MADEYCPICGEKTWSNMSDDDKLTYSCDHLAKWSFKFWFAKPDQRPDFVEWAKEYFKEAV